jgi:hypothetical protein
MSSSLPVHDGVQDVSKMKKSSWTAFSLRAATVFRIAVHDVQDKSLYLYIFIFYTSHTEKLLKYKNYKEVENILDILDILDTCMNMFV